MRELAAKYELSHRTVILTLQQLVEDGTLRSVPRVGMVVARPVELRSDVMYLLAMPGAGESPDIADKCQLIAPSFEACIAELGGRTARVGLAQILSSERGNSGRLGGVFVPWLPESSQRALLTTMSTPVVCYATAGDHIADNSAVDELDLDMVVFDNVGGGRRAAQTLRDQGNQNIGFAGLHSASDGGQGAYQWSVDRRLGWTLELDSSGADQGPEILPEMAAHDWQERLDSVSQQAFQSVVRQEVDALVCSNDRVAIKLIEQLRSSGVPLADWPPLVGFDSSVVAGSYLLTSVSRPWDRVARTAAALLWRQQPIHARPCVHKVEMSLTQRLSAEPGWAARVPQLLAD